jgi:hypothetical protein
MTAGRQARHRATREQRLVVGVSMEKHRRAHQLNAAWMDSDRSTAIR